MESLYNRHIKLLSALKTKFTSGLYYKLPWQKRLVGITGARGVGKTTMILQYIKNTYGFSRKALYYSFDSVDFPFANLFALAQEFVKRGGEHLFLDEVHKYPNWSQELKDIYDTFPDLKVTFTGSSVLDIHRGKADLSRRALIFRMQGLSFRQFVEIVSSKKLPTFSLQDILDRNREITIGIYQMIKPYEFWEDYLRFGYYPFFLEDQEFYLMRLESVINQVLEVDLPAVFKVEFAYVNKLKRFISILAQDLPQKTNIRSLAATLEVSWQTVVKYLNYLSKADLVHLVYPYGKNISALSKPEKVYLHHPNMFYVFREQIENKGNLRETFFVNQVSYLHKVETHQKGDFIVDGKYIFEIGGKGKTSKQIAGLPNSYVVADDLEFGEGKRIPLWLFGFLY